MITKSSAYRRCVDRAGTRADGRRDPVGALLPAPVALTGGDEAAPGESPGPHRCQPQGHPDRVGDRGSQPDPARLGNYFRTDNATVKFTQGDRYVVWRLKRLLVKKRGRNLRAGVADQWTEDWFNARGLYRFRGTIRYPKAA